MITGDVVNDALKTPARVVYVPSSELVDYYYGQCAESILSSGDMAREFVRGNGITAQSIAEKAWELALEMMKCRQRNSRGRG